MMRFPSSVRMNLVLVVLAGVFPVLAVVLGSGWERRAHEIDHAGLTTLRLAEYYAHQQESEAARIKAVLAALARDQDVRALNAEACGRLFRNMLTANPNYVNFALMDRNGEALASALPFTRQNLAERKEFREAMATGAFAVGEYAVGKVSGAQILPFAFPVRDAGDRLCGALIATLRLQDVASVFDVAKLPENSFVGLADREGRRLYRYPPIEGMDIGVQIAKSAWDRIWSASKQALFTETSTDGVRRVYAVRRVSLGQETPYLNIFVGIPEQQIIARADAVTRTYLFWLTGSLLLSICLAWLVGKYGIHDRVVNMARVAQRLGKGEFSARSELMERGGSLGQLARTMDHMALALERDRAELLQATEARELEAQRRAALMDLSGDGIVVLDQELRVMEANRRFSEMLGYPPEALVGLYAWDYEARMSQDELCKQFSAPSKVRVMYESQCRRKDGTVFPVEVNAAGSEVFGKTLILSVVRDVAERKKAERDLYESELRYRTLFEKSLDAIAVMEGAPLRFTWVNPAFSSLHGYAAEEIYAMGAEELWSLIHPDDREIVRRNLPFGLSEQEAEARLSYRILRKDGAGRWVEATARRLQVSDRPMVMLICRDVTQERENREQLARAKEQAEAASRAKSEFLANMSHEIRTPLNGVMGMLQLIQRRAKDSDLSGYAEIAMLASKRLTQLLSDILDLSRIEAGRLLLHNQPFSLRETLGLVEQLFLPTARQTGVELRITLDPALPDGLTGDALRLQQVLNNLIGNAFKFTLEGSVVVEGILLPVLEENRRRVLFTVTDTGCGIPEDKLRSLFKPFTQASVGYSRSHQGAGLGLSICKQLVLLMGGSIFVDSDVDLGTRIYVSIPFGLASPVSASPAPPAVAGSVLAQGCRVLMADDDWTSCLFTRRQLESIGAVVTIARNGRQALDALRETAFDLVLMDVQMPEMDGVEAAKRIRNGEAGAEKARVPILALTAYAMPGDREAFLDAGMNGYLSKPVEIDELIRTMERLLAQAGG